MRVLAVFWLNGREDIVNTMRRWAIVSATLAMGLLGSAAVGLGQTGNKQSVKLKYPPGTYRMTQTSVSNGSTTVGGQEEKSRDEDRMTWRFTVPAPDEAGDKKAALKLTAVLEKSDGQEVWNSDQPESGFAGSAFVYKAIMAADVQVAFDADDALVEVVGLDKVMSEIAEAAQTDEQKYAVAEHSTFGDKLIERQFRTMESIVPRGAVAPGDKWQAGLRVELPMVGEIRTRFDCTAKSVQNGRIVLGAAGVHAVSRPKEATIQGQRVTVTKMAVKDDITMTVDLATGRVLAMETVSLGDISIAAKGENGEDVDVLVKVDVKNTLTMESEGAEPAKQESLAATPATAPATRPAAKSGGPAVTYRVHRYIDQGGLRDPQTGQWLEGFRMLVPKDWQFTGGFRWIANEKPANMLSKTDLLNPVKSDYTVASPDGRSVFRQYPVEYWVQTSSLFQPGQNYNGMIVCAALTPEQYITQFVLPRQRGVQAADMRVVKQGPLDELAAKYSVESRQLGAMLGPAADAGLSFKAGTVTVEYTENGQPMREQFTCILQYIQTAGMIMWWPRMNFSVRAPRDQFEAQIPVFTTMASSVQTNPYWSIGLIRLRDQVQISIAQADAYANKVRNEIAAAHAQTTREMARDGGYLSGDYYDYKGTDGNRYNLPTDKYHFMNQGGDILSQNDSVPPSSEWTSIEPYNQ